MGPQMTQMGPQMTQMTQMTQMMCMLLLAGCAKDNAAESVLPPLNLRNL